MGQLGLTNVTATGRSAVVVDKTSGPRDNVGTVAIMGGTFTGTAAIQGNPFTAAEDPNGNGWMNIAVQRMDTLAIENTPTVTANTARAWKFDCSPFAQVGINVSAVTGTIPLNVLTYYSPIAGPMPGTPLTAAFPGTVSSSSASAGIGYATGAGGAVTQITSITTGVTLNTVCGTITTVSSTLAAGVDASFTLTNSAIAALDVIVINTKSYAGTADGIPICKIQSTAAGSCIINIHNQGAVSLDAVIVLDFAVIKSVAA